MNAPINPASFAATNAPVRLPTPITVAYGDGIGPEIMAAALKVLEAGGASLAPEVVDIGERVYRAGHTSGITADVWASLRRTRVFFKAPITTPQGGGFKSLNVTVRKTLGLYANVRPCTVYAPFVATGQPDLDVVIVRENEEDLYAGIEHRQTDQVFQAIKIITRPGTEKIVRYAFEYARAHGRKKVSCFTKDNIMKLTDGLFRMIFDEIGAEYPDLEQEHMIFDIGAARLAASPGRFDVIVMPNLYGDILSDVVAEIAGSVGLGGSANIGEHCAMFEAIHGSALDLAGKGVANPSGLILAGVQMLVHIGQPEAAERVHNAWLATIEDGIHTGDIVSGATVEHVGTAALAEAVIARMGQRPQVLAPADYAGRAPLVLPQWTPAPPARKALVGVDVFVHAAGISPDVLAARMRAAVHGAYDLTLITNRGVKVWPQGMAETFCTDHWRCRFEVKPGAQFNHAMVAELLGRLAKAGVDFIKTEHLCTFGGVPGYSLGQGQ